MFSGTFSNMIKINVDKVKKINSIILQSAYFGCLATCHPKSAALSVNTRPDNCRSSSRSSSFSGSTVPSLPRGHWCSRVSEDAHLLTILFNTLSNGERLGLQGFFLGSLEATVLALTLTCTHTVGLDKELHRPEQPRLDFSSTRTHAKERPALEMGTTWGNMWHYMGK